MTEMLSLGEAQARLLALGECVDIEDVPVASAAGCWLARDATALRTQPFADLSAMDGYAIRFDDLPGPWSMAGENAAGTVETGRIEPGQAMRIFTGAPLPDGADTVLVQEDAEIDGARLILTGAGPGRRGAHIRRAGEDFSEGEAVITAGERITPARLGLAIAAGFKMLPVCRPVRVALVSTGDELAAPGSDAAPGRLPASNAPMLAAQMAGLPVAIDDKGIVPDDLDAIQRVLRRAASVDIIVTIGGASVGDHDLIRPALEAEGGSIDFWRVAIKPGKPLLVGRLGTSLVVGLPGNPVSAFVTARIFLLPLIAKMAGAADPLPRSRPATLSAALPATGERHEFLRGYRSGGGVAPVKVQDSGMLTSLAAAALLIDRPPNGPAAEPGDQVFVFDL